MILCVSNCFDVFRWKLIGPSILQGPPKGLPRASQGPPKGLPRASQGPPKGLPASPYRPNSRRKARSPRVSAPSITRNCTLGFPGAMAIKNRWNFDVKSSKFIFEVFQWSSVSSVVMMYLPTVAGKPIIICVSAWYFVSDSVAGLRCDFEVCLACSMCSCKGRISSY